MRALWGLNPLRTSLMMALNIIRSLFPAFRGYSQVRTPIYVLKLNLELFFPGFNC